MDDNPLSQLLSQHENETTILDQHFKKSIAPKIEKNNATLQHKENTPSKMEEDKSDEDNDQPIGLVHRQPSYSSLHGNLIGKDGVKVDRLPDLTEEGEETNARNQDLENKEPKPTKTSKPTKNNINQINSFSSQDNVIAFDEHDDSEDVPIGLTYRQPSFSSMGDHLISKGGDSLADMVPLKTIPIEDAIIEEENEDNIQKGTEEEADNEEDEEDEENPQVQIVKDLKQKNKDRWLKMGYEPPPNLIQLTRAQSQSVFNQNQVFMQQPSAISPLLFSPVQEEDENPISNNKKNNINDIYEPSNQKSTIKTTTNSNSPAKPTTDKPKIVHRRCGSNGMKLGEASTSLARMSQALMIYDSNSKLPNTPEEYDDEEEESPENEFEEEEEADSYKNMDAKDEEEIKEEKKDNKKEKTKKHETSDRKHKHKDKKQSKSKKQRNHKSQSNSFAFRDLNEKKRTYLLPSESSSYDSDSEDNDYYYYHGNDELFGKLGQIVREDQSSDIYKAILTGKLPQNSNDDYPIKHRIQQYINTCINNLWVDETEYLSKIIDGTNKHHHTHHHNNRTNKNNYHFISHHQRSFSSHHRKMKNLNPVERLKMKAADEDEMYETKIQETLLKQQHMLEMLNDEYKEAANDLDARYLIQTSPNRNNEGEYDSDWSDSPAVLELKAMIRHLLKTKKYNAVQELSAKLKQLEADEACEVSEILHEHYVNADNLLKERFAMRRALLLSKIQFELQEISEERQNTARRYSKSISRLKSLNIEIRELYDLPENDDDDQYDVDYDDYSNDIDTGRYPKTINRENDEKIIELMAERMMNANSSSGNDDYDESYEKSKKKKKSKKNKDKKKDKKKKEKKEKKKKEKKYD